MRGTLKTCQGEDCDAYHINDGQAAVLDQSMVLSGYAYLPGDANMSAGSWKPSVLGADATEVQAGDLYVQVDEVAASTAAKGSGYFPLYPNPLRIGD